MLLELKDELIIPTSVDLILYTDAKILYDCNGRAYVKGKIKQREQSHNTIVTNGHSYISNKMSGKAVDWMRNMAVGTTSGGKGAGTNALEAEISRIYMTDWENTVLPITVYRAIFDAGVGTGLLVEAGIFDNQLAGNMLCWADYGAINKTINDILEIRWSHTY